MALSLYTSKTFLANCRNFRVFDCNLYPENCLTFPERPFDLDYPFFSISGVMMDLKFSIGNYVRTRPASIYYATTCTGNRFHTNQVMGVVGLSVSDTNYNNIYTENNQYSIFLTDDDTAGELIFGQDLGHAVDSTAGVTLHSTDDWELVVSRIHFADYHHEIVGNAIFDLVAPFIGVPAALYLQILDHLESEFLLNCQRDVIMPECLFPDDITKLPNLTLTIYSGMPYRIDLRPDLYLKKVRDNRFKLMLAGLAIDPHRRDLVHVTPSYVNYTILGHPFMKHYYTVFNYGNLQSPNVTLYLAKQTTDTPADNSSKGMAIGAILLGIVVIGALAACLWAINRSRAKANEEARKETYAHPAIARNVIVERPIGSDIKDPLVIKQTPGVLVS